MMVKLHEYYMYVGREPFSVSLCLDVNFCYSSENARDYSTITHGG